jgi:hypothetical protein
VHPSRAQHQILPQPAANPASEQSESKASALRQYRGTQSDESNNSSGDGKQPGDSKQQKGSDLATASDQTAQPSQVAQVLPLGAKVLMPQDSTGSTEVTGGLQGDSNQSDDSKKPSGVNPAAAAIPSRETLPMIAAVPTMPSGNGLPQVSSPQSSSGAQLQAAIPTPDVPIADVENEPAPSAEPAQVQHMAPAPTLDVSSAAQPASSGPISVAVKLTPVEGDAPAAETSDARSRGQIPLQRQGLSPASSQDDTNAKPGVDPAPEHFAKAEAAFAPVAPAAASSTEAPRNATAAGPSTSTQAASQMEPLIETPAPAATAGSGHDITIKVPDATERGMDVRFVERGGEVHVAIRTSDSEMAQTLRNGMNDFVGRMEHAGIRAEVWRPGADASPSQNPQDDARQQPQDQRGSRNQSGMQDREDDSRNSKKPRWVEAMEDSIGSQSSQTA